MMTRCQKLILEARPPGAVGSWTQKEDEPEECRRATATEEQIKRHLLDKMIPNNLIISTVERGKIGLKKWI